ncbi:MAG: hypothetical protein E7506_02775 [Ruminococcus sp.]|nr:hypothetical protein [Ruminococcus sp.]
MKIQRLSLKENEVIKLKNRIIAMLTVTVMLMSAAVGCSKKENKKALSATSTAESSDVDSSAVESGLASENEKTESGPVLEIENVTAKAGERVDVKVMLSGVPDGWSFCGIHFSYPDVLKPTISERTGNVECVRGDAVADMTDFLAVNWVDNKPPELIEKNLNSIFFCTMASGDYGTDGHITTFEFEIPADAQSGTVYDLEFFFREGDMFTNMAQDTVMQDQAFANWKHGSITVE